MIRSDRLLYDIAPDGFGERNCETWGEWRERAHDVLPQFPDEVLEQWVYRHWKAVLCNWGWLDFQAMQFEKQWWSTEDVLVKIHSPHQDIIKKLTRRMSNPIFQRSWLVQRMQDQGTWPIAPIVLECSKDLFATNGRHLIAPYNLLEGHHRMGYLKGLVDSGQHCEKQHPVWVARLPLH